MYYVVSGLLIVVIHSVFKENPYIVSQKLWKLMGKGLLFISAAVLLSTWLQTMVPVFLATVITATLLQINYSRKMSK